MNREILKQDEQFNNEIVQNLKNELQSLNSKIKMVRENQDFGTYKNLILAYKEVLGLYENMFNVKSYENLIKPQNIQKDIIEEAKNIIKEKSNDDTKFRQTIGQLLIDNMKSEIDNWDKVSIPNIFSKYMLYEIFEDIFQNIISNKIDSDFCQVAEFRNISWGDSFNFYRCDSRLNVLKILGKDNILRRRRLDSEAFILETKIENFNINDLFEQFLRNKKYITLNTFVDSIISNIKKYINDCINTLQEQTVSYLTSEKLIKIGFEDLIIHETKEGLCLCIKIGIGMLEQRMD